MLHFKMNEADTDNAGGGGSDTKVVAEREAVRQVHPDQSVYAGGDGKSWAQKINESRAKHGKDPIDFSGKAKANTEKKAAAAPKKDAKPAKKEVEQPRISDEEAGGAVEEEPAAQDSTEGEQDPSPADSEGAEQVEEGEESGEEGEEGDGDGEAYTPNPKFMADKKEHELPAWLAKSITTPEQEAEIKDVYSKALGLDFVKARFTETEEAFNSLNETHEGVMDGIKELHSIFQTAVKSQNLLLLDDFFARLKIPQAVVLQYAADKVNYLEAEPEQRQGLDSSLAALRRARALEAENSGLSNNAYKSEVRSKAMLLQAELAKPEIAPIVQAFETAQGRKPGDFLQLIAEHGEFVWYKQKKDLSPEEAVAQVIQKYGLSAPAPKAGNPAPAPKATNGAPAPQGQVQSKVPAQHRNTPVIPSVKGKSGASPTKQKPKSIAELRELAKKAAKTRR